MKRRITKWRTEEGAKNFIDNLLYHIKHGDCTITLELEYSKSHKNKIKIHSKNNASLFFSADGYANEKNRIKAQKTNITKHKNEIEKFFVHQEEDLIENIKKHSIEKGFLGKLRHLLKNVTTLNGLTVNAITENPIIIDYIDASFNFRKLKIKFLHTEYDET